MESTSKYLHNQPCVTWKTTIEIRQKVSWVTEIAFTIFLFVFCTKLTWTGTERNQLNQFAKSGSHDFANIQNSSHNHLDCLESTFTIECVNLSFDATEEILEQFELGEDVEFGTVEMVEQVAVFVAPDTKNT